MRQVIIGHHRHPFTALALDDDIGRDVVVGRDRETLRRARIERADEIRRAGDLLQRHAEFAREDGVTFVGEIVDVLIDQAPGEALLFAQALQLDQQALAQILGADTDGIEALQQPSSPCATGRWEWRAEGSDRRSVC
jgi:hypothetical protein